MASLTKKQINKKQSGWLCIRWKPSVHVENIYHESFKKNITMNEKIKKIICWNCQYITFFNKTVSQVVRFQTDVSDCSPSSEWICNKNLFKNLLSLVCKYKRYFSKEPIWYNLEKCRFLHLAFYWNGTFNIWNLNFIAPPQVPFQWQHSPLPQLTSIPFFQIYHFLAQNHCNRPDKKLFSNLSLYLWS